MADKTPKRASDGGASLQVNVELKSPAGSNEMRDKESSGNERGQKR